MFYMELPKHFSLLRDISPTVDDYLERELYKLDYAQEGELVDTYSPKDILGTCYAIILDELRYIGVNFALDSNDLIQDIYTCGYVYLVRKFVDRPYFAKLLQATDTKEAVAKYLDTDDQKLNLLEDLVNIVNIKAHDYELSEMSYILQNTYTTQAFADYIKSILTSMEEPDAIILKDVSLEERYTKHIANLRHLAYRYTHTAIDLLNLHTQVDMNKISKLLRDYDRDKILPDTIAIYSIIDKDNVPVNMYATKKKYMDIHHNNSPHHVEYWLTDSPTKQRFTIDNLILLVVHHIEPNTSSEEFKEEVDDTIHKLDNILSDQFKELASKIVTTLQPLMAKDPVVQGE